MVICGNTRVYLLRHGEYENPQYLFPGRGPGFPLTDNGKSQVFAVAQSLISQSIAAIYTSPVLRAKQTAEILSERLNLEITCDERLTEIKTGMEGSPMADLDAIGGNVYTPEFAAKGVETPDEIAARMRACIDEVAIRHKDEAVVCVSHGDPIRFAVVAYKGLPVTFEGAKALIVPLAGGFRLEFFDSGVITCIPTHTDQ